MLPNAKCLCLHSPTLLVKKMAPPPRSPRVPLGGDQVGKLCAALEDAFTLDQLRQLMVMGLDGNLRLNLDAVVPVAGRNLHDICNDLVLWALRDERVGLHGLLDAALRTNPANPLLLALQSEWAGVTFTAPACPYPGMKPFTASERGRFYGRDAEIQAAVDWLRRRRFLAVIGSSGSGKSSLLAAGILPALETSHYFAGMPWDVHTMRPGATPFTTLAALLDLAVPRTVDRTARRRRWRRRCRTARRVHACCWWWTSTRSCSRPLRPPSAIALSVRCFSSWRCRTSTWSSPPAPTSMPT